MISDYLVRNGQMTSLWFLLGIKGQQADYFLCIASYLKYIFMADLAAMRIFFSALVSFLWTNHSHKYSKSVSFLFSLRLCCKSGGLLDATCDTAACAEITPIDPFLSRNLR